MNKIAFELRKIQVPIGDLLPLRKINDPVNTIKRYKAILVSLKEVALIEPLMVYPQTDMPGKYLILAGHLRAAIPPTHARRPRPRHMALSARLPPAGS